MNFSLEVSGAITTGSISPEAMAQINNMIGGRLGMIFGGLFVVWMIVILAITVLMVISRRKIFEKASLPGRGIFIPFYNMYLIFKLGGRSGWNFLWILIPPVFAIMMIINFFKIAVRFGKPSVYGLGIWFIGVVFIPILAFDHSTYIPMPTPAPTK